MIETEILNSTKSAVGQSLAGPAGEVCIRTRCQDIIPRQLSTACRKEGRGRHARQVCRPFLAKCQNDESAHSSCKTSCAKYYKGEQAKQCFSECIRAHCKVVPEYEHCVKMQTVLDVLQCLQDGSGRGIAEGCLQRRCGLSTSSDPLTLPGR